MQKFLYRYITISTLSLVIFLLFIFLALISVNLSSEFSEAVQVFHQGELLGNYWHMLSYYGGHENFPLLIHGSMDYWPSIIAGNIFGDEKIIFGTRLAVVVITFISWIIFIFLGVKIISITNRNNPLNLGFVALFVLTLPLLHLNPMAIEESPVGLRDVFILLQICFLTYFYTSKKYNIVFLSLTFLLLPATLYWSYDRGVASTVACLTLLIYFVLSKRYFEFFVSFLMIAISTAVFEKYKIAGSITENTINILYWARYSSEIWGTTFNFSRQGVISLLPLIFIAIVFALVYVSFRDKKNTIPTGYLIFISVVVLFLAKSAYNRPNIHRGLMSTWPAVLLLLWIASSRISMTWNILNINKPINSMQDSLVKSSFIFLTLSVILFSVPIDKISSFRKSIISSPTDKIIAGVNLTDVSEELKGEKCSLNMVNQGVITLLSKTSHCTKFPYLIYASKNSQRELIEIINKSDIGSIVIDSHDWSTNIDERSMVSRLPDLHSFLMGKYKKQISVGNYLILKN